MIIYHVISYEDRLLPYRVPPLNIGDIRMREAPCSIEENVTNTHHTMGELRSQGVNGVGKD
jgi:hypothetical protein